MAKPSSTEKTNDSSNSANTTESSSEDTSSDRIIVKKIGFEDRAVSDVAIPLWDDADSNKLWDKDDKPNLKFLREHFRAEGKLSEKDCLKLINKAADCYAQELNILQLQDPISVCGDIHGQFYDLLKLFEIGGDPKDTQYLFLGDYVDRGYFACEVCLYLFAFKIHTPKKFHMLRGNHECRHLTSYFNFKKECIYKYSLSVYNAFMTCFDNLPLCAILNRKFFCVHGGLSPDLQSIDQIAALDRFREPPPNGLMCDLLWSDPMDDEDEEACGDTMEYKSNELRGCSYVYSFKGVCTFLRKNQLLSVIRAHEAQDEGFRLYKKNESTHFPSVICIFSAPNYCDVYNNKGAIIRFQDNLMNIRQFNCSPHPYYLPNFMNAFGWSLPFVAEKVTEMLLTILNLCDDTDDEEDDSSIDNKRADRIRTKIRTVGRISRMYRTLREEHENILILKGLAGGVIPRGILSEGAEAIKSAIGNFEKSKEIDKMNERRPSDVEVQEKEKEDAAIIKTYKSASNLDVSSVSSSSSSKK